MKRQKNKTVLRSLDLAYLQKIKGGAFLFSRNNFTAVVFNQQRMFLLHFFQKSVKTNKLKVSL